MYILENKYNRIFELPKLGAGELAITLEEIVNKIVELGLIRISDDYVCNFVNLPLLNGRKNFSFSSAEIFDNNLSKQTYKIIAENLTLEEQKNPQKSINIKLDYLNKQIKKYTAPPKDYEIKIARILAQSAHPAVLLNLIYDRAKIFVSFSHSISDLLNVQNWQSYGSNSGMQSTSYEEIAIYISCAGNPFIKENENNTGDGFNALARLMIVGAQEIGHYADIKKLPVYGTRFSMDVRNNKPNNACNQARLKDLNNIKSIRANLEKCGLKKLYNLENRIEVQSKFRKFSISLFCLKIFAFFYRIYFETKCDSKKIYFYKFIKSKKLANEIVECISDYLFNLEPQADVYRDKNLEKQAAIACAEAIARVPQQQVKWGEYITKYFMQNMYIYYAENLITEAKKYYEKYSSSKFFINNKKVYVPFYKSILKMFSHFSK